MHLHHQAVGPLFGWTNAFVVATGPLAVVIDPGQGASPWVRDVIAAHGYEVAGILLTHGHMDHTWDAVSLADRFKCPVYLHPRGHAFLESPETAVPQDFPMHLMRKHPHRMPADLRGATSLTMVGDMDVRTIPAPGHTACSVAFVLSTSSERFLVTGDTLLGGDCAGAPIAPTGSSGPLVASVTTVRREARAADLVLPGHGAVFSNIARQRRKESVL